MGWFLIFFGCIWILSGLIMVFTPNKMKNFTLKLLSLKNAKYLGISPLIAGILFYFARFDSRAPWFIVLIALLAITKAIYLFAYPMEKIKAEWVLKYSANQYRLLGLLALCLGVTVIYLTI